MTYRRFWIYFLLFLFNTISYTDRVNMSLAGHPIAQEFGLSPIALGYLFSSFLWAYVLMMLPGGRLIDSMGAHRVAAICATIWSVAQILTGVDGWLRQHAADSPRLGYRRSARFSNQLSQRT